jgi:hypothetical protein
MTMGRILGMERMFPQEKNPTLFDVTFTANQFPNLKNLDELQ